MHDDDDDHELTQYTQSGKQVNNYSLFLFSQKPTPHRYKINQNGCASTSTPPDSFTLATGSHLEGIKLSLYAQMAESSARI